VSDGAEVSGEQGLQTDVLDELTAAVNYREVLVGLSLPWLGEHAIEIGSGNGDYASSWAEKASGSPSPRPLNPPIDSPRALQGQSPDRRGRDVAAK